MEVLAEIPPPLPPKTKKPFRPAEDSEAFAKGESVVIAPKKGREVASLKIVNNRRRDEDGLAPPRSSQVSERRIGESQSEKECDGEKTGPKIITWGATKKGEADSRAEDLYENVSTCGDANHPESRGRRKTPRIEVRQEENKTVVKISIKDAGSPEEEMEGEGEGEGVFEGAYENVCCDGGGIYENAYFSAGERGSCESLSGGCYENVDPREIVVGSFNRPAKKDLRTEANYCNLGGDESRCDQVNDNHEFQVSQNNVVSIIGKNLSPPAGDAAKRDEGGYDSYENVNADYHIYANENLCRNGQKPDETAEKLESRKKTGEKKSSVVEVFLQKPAMVKVEKLEPEYADDNSSGDPFDSGTCSDVDSLPNFAQGKKGNVVVTIKSLAEDKTSGHGRAESLTSSGVGVDSEESDDEKSNISCDSLNSTDPYPQSNSEDHGYHTPNSEDKTGSPIEYENVLKAPPEDPDKNDIIQQVANVSQKIKNLRRENSGGVYAAKPLDLSDFEEYENVFVFEQPPRTHKKKPPPPPPPAKPSSATPRSLPQSGEDDGKKALPKSLLRDIRNVRLSSTYPSGEKQEGGKNSVASAVSNFEGAAKHQPGKNPVVEERTYEERKSVKTNKICAMEVDTDKFYKFHLAENIRENGKDENVNEEETFAGVKDYLCREKPAAITSAKGTIRGVKNRVKAGIATFLQLQENKSYKDRDAGKVVVYTTTMGIVRETYHKCLKVKQILRTLLVKFEERDVFMSTEAQDEIRDRMKCSAILVPQVFVEGQHIGDAETIERLNEMGELRTILKPYKSADACSTCKVCGGYRLLPCSVCKGSKKSIHRNHFTAEFVALKCMNCDQVGLTKCHAC